MSFTSQTRPLSHTHTRANRHHRAPSPTPRAVWAGDGNCTLPLWQQIAKPLPQGSAAVVVANHGFGTVSTSVNLTSVPGLACAAGGGSCAGRDVHAHADLGRFTGSFPVANLASHDSVFIVVSS